MTFDAAVKCVKNVLAADRLSRGPGGRRVCAVGGEGAPSEPSPDPGEAAPIGVRPAPAEPEVLKVGGAAAEPSMLEQILRRIEQLELQLTAANRMGQTTVTRARGNGGELSTPKCLCCGEPGHTKPECRFRLARCFSCGKVGHVQRTCFSGNAGGEGAQGGARAPRFQGRRGHEF